MRKLEQARIGALKVTSYDGFDRGEQQSIGGSNFQLLRFKHRNALSQRGNGPHCDEFGRCSRLLDSVGSDDILDDHAKS